MSTSRRITNFPQLETYGKFAEAFGREAQNVQRYQYFARLAEIEGQQHLVKLFNELAESSQCCAHGHLDVLRTIGDPRSNLPIGSSRSNVIAATASESAESVNDYPELARQAHADGLEDFASWAETLVSLKRAHAARCQEILKELQSQTVAD